MYTFWIIPGGFVQLCTNLSCAVRHIPGILPITGQNVDGVARVQAM